MQNTINESAIIAMKVRTAMVIGFRSLLVLVALACPGMTVAADIPLKTSPPAVVPLVIYTGIPSEVIISVPIYHDPDLVKESVNLLRMDANGVRKVVDRLYDDRTHGDVLPDDGTFTNRITFNEPVPTTIKLQVSAGYKGQIRRRISDVFTLDVLPMPDFQRVWAALLDRLVNKDLEGALQYFTETKRPIYRQIFEKVGIDLIASDFKTARDLKLKEIVIGSADFSFTATLNGQDKRGMVVFERELDGSWRVRNLGF
jgi:hypothetical protein